MIHGRRSRVATRARWLPRGWQRPRGPALDFLSPCSVPASGATAVQSTVDSPRCIGVLPRGPALRPLAEPCLCADGPIRTSGRLGCSRPSRHAAARACQRILAAIASEGTRSPPRGKARRLRRSVVIDGKETHMWSKRRGPLITGALLVAIGVSACGDVVAPETGRGALGDET